MLVETVFTGIASLAGGLAAGILGSKLALLLLLKILHIPAKFGFYISWKGIKVCAVSYGVILVLTLFNNLRRVHFSRPVELLSGGSAGEREPKSKLLWPLRDLAVWEPDIIWQLPQNRLLMRWESFL